MTWTPAIPALSRDCGFSTKLSDGMILWLFCDSYYVSNTGSTHAVLYNTAAMASPWTPTALVDHTSDFMGETILNGDANHIGGQSFVTLPNAPLNFPCDQGTRKAWPVGLATVAKAGPGGSDRVLVYYARECDQSQALGPNHFVHNGIGLAEYDYALGSFNPAVGVTQPLVSNAVLNDNLFDASTPWGYGAMTSTDNKSVHVYRCDTSGCFAGKVAAAQAATASSYSWWNGSAWGSSAVKMTMPGSSLPVSELTVQYVPQIASYVMAYTPCSSGCLQPMTNQVAFRTSKSPQGPWSWPTTVLLPNCTLDPAVTPCRAIASHVEQSSTSLVISYQRDGEGTFPSGREHTATVPFATLNPLNLDANVGSVTNLSTATFTFGPSTTVTYECARDGGPYAACASPLTLSGFGTGNHTLSVRSVTSAGARSLPQTRQWTVDTGAPTAGFSSRPPSTTSATDATITFTGTDTQTPWSELRFECSADGAAFSPCTSSVTLDGLLPGSHTFAVRSVDRAVNRSTAVQTAWTVTFTFTSSIPGAATLGASYTGTFSTNASSLGTVSYAVTKGSLPPGLTLSASGTVSGAPTATGSYGPVEVTASATWGTTVQNVTVVVNASIAGTVRNAVSAAPVAGIRVQVFNSTGLIMGTTFTAADGTYQLGNLTSGAYRLSYFDPASGYVTQYWNNQASLGAATALNIVAGTTAIADVNLQPLLVITGKVTDRISGAPIGTVRVGLYNNAGTAIAIANTAADGTYRFGNLAVDTYRLSFTDTTGAHAIDYWSQSSTLAGAASISSPAGGTVVADEAMEPLTTITGAVTDRSSGAALSGIWVTLYDSSGSAVALAFTSSSGGYTFGTLRLGTYRLSFIDTSGAHVTQYWTNQTSLAAATSITASGGAITADAAM
jgi:hypothetical protein